MSLKILDGFDDAFIGVAVQCGITTDPIAVYDRAKILKNLMKEGMSQEDADEWVQYNVEGAYVGEDTPFILETFESPTAYAELHAEQEELPFLKHM